MQRQVVKREVQVMSVSPMMHNKTNDVQIYKITTKSGPLHLRSGTGTNYKILGKGNASFSKLKDGQQIAYWLPYSGSGNATLELSLPNGTTTGAIPCYFSQQTRLSTQYGAGNVIRLTYRENAQYFSYTVEKGWWADANYNTDTYDRIRRGAIKAKEALAYFKFIVADTEGYFHLAEGKPFDVSKPILWVTSNAAAGSSILRTHDKHARDTQSHEALSRRPHR